MTPPIAPDDTAGLTTILDNALTWAEDANIGIKAARAYGANAVARAVCPESHVVVSTDDLRAVLRLVGAETDWQADDDDQEAIDRLRAKVDPE